MDLGRYSNVVGELGVLRLQCGGGNTAQAQCQRCLGWGCPARRCGRHGHSGRRGSNTTNLKYGLPVLKRGIQTDTREGTVIWRFSILLFMDLVQKTHLWEGHNWFWFRKPVVFSWEAVCSLTGKNQLREPLTGKWYWRDNRCMTSSVSRLLLPGKTFSEINPFSRISGTEHLMMIPPGEKVQTPVARKIW